MNETLRRLYQETIVEQQANPRNRGPFPEATHAARVDNPLCGDRVTVRLRLDSNRILAARFEGDGCAISLASASLLTTRVATLTVEEARSLSRELDKLLSKDGHAGADREALGDLVALEGTRLFPARIRCATLAWEALERALDGDRLI